MVAWSCLPNEMKVEIVKRMDLRTRFCFRHVSTSTMTLVDSTPLYIPRIQIITESDQNIRFLIFESIRNCVVVFYRTTSVGTLFGWNNGDPTSNEPLKQRKNNRKSKFKTVEPPINALAATLKTLTSGFKTILGGLEITGTLTDAGLLKLLPLLEGCTIRTRIISLSSDEHPLLPILMKCSRSDVQEIQIWEDRVKFVTDEEAGKLKIKTSMVKSVWYSVDEELVPEEYRFLLHRYDNGEARSAIEENFRKIDDDTFMIGFDGEETQKIEFFHTPCGHMNRLSMPGLFEERPQKCMRRWKCEKHSSPFEFWYANISPFAGLSITTLFEKILPVLNGVCPVNKYLDEMEEKFVKWKTKAEKEKYRYGQRMVTKKPPRRVGVFGYMAHQFTRFWWRISILLLISVVFYVLGRVFLYFWSS